MRSRWPRLSLLLPAGAMLGLVGCMGGMPVPMGGLDRQLEQAGISRAPALAGRWLALIGSRGGRNQVVLVDVERQAPVPLPGLNRPDALPLSVAVDDSGGRLAVVRRLAMILADGEAIATSRQDVSADVR